MTSQEFRSFSRFFTPRPFGGPLATFTSNATVARSAFRQAPPAEIRTFASSSPSPFRASTGLSLTNRMFSFEDARASLGGRAPDAAQAQAGSTTSEPLKAPGLIQAVMAKAAATAESPAPCRSAAASPPAPQPALTGEGDAVLRAIADIRNRWKNGAPYLSAAAAPPLPQPAPTGEGEAVLRGIAEIRSRWLNGMFGAPPTTESPTDEEATARIQKEIAAASNR